MSHSLTLAPSFGSSLSFEGCTAAVSPWRSVSTLRLIVANRLTGSSTAGHLRLSRFVPENAPGSENAKRDCAIKRFNAHWLCHRGLGVLDSHVRRPDLGAPLPHGGDGFLLQFPQLGSAHRSCRVQEWSPIADLRAEFFRQDSCRQVRQRALG